MLRPAARLVLNIVPVPVAVVVMSAPLTARSPVTVTSSGSP